MENKNYIEQIREYTKDHQNWMKNSINLIASENITSKPIKEVLASDLSHRYAEGLPNKRFYEGCKYIDKIENLTVKLSKKLFKAEHVNVQPTSGVVANLASFFALTKPNDTLMALRVPYGGHISHAEVSAAGIRGLKIRPHPFDNKTMNIDADAMKKDILKTKPKLVLLGGSLFLFPHPVEEAKEAADEVGAKVMYDGAHVLGLIAGERFQDPLKEGADLMVGSTHKTLPGPQGGIIFTSNELKQTIDNAVFPGVVSNHHLHHVAGLGIACAEMLEFGKDYATQTIKNSKKLAECLYDLDFNVLCPDLDFTESHQLVMDIKSVGSSSEISQRLETNNIIVNKNLLPWDEKTETNEPSGIRIGTQEITRRGLKESEMEVVANFINEVVINGKNVKNDAMNFMSDYTTLNYSFKPEEAYEYIKF
ncbi:Glycine hydroxymethyltransferase [Methanobacterium lacus]|uniref:Serine hydroxymethyltransferase n=1 Tax=Methanobacterium lacus (strain AL-21) TaxID=877455 RepID=F0T6W5_METLA|nr:serine hydroxymethyltransferase [Methanobacterium lacus]ADZ09485.1 Glycine hydroxymethyltransferase [Methanobacterium lacus]